MTNEGSGDVADATLREFASGQKLFGRYTLVKILGRGGMGIVWLVRDEELEREVALKFLPETVVHDRSLLNDLKRETRRSLELTHKNIVRIYDFVDDERSGCISMEYVDGQTLSNLRAEKEQKVFEPEGIAACSRLRANCGGTLSPSEKSIVAIKLYQEAIELDPKFALARVRLSLRISAQFSK